MIRQPLSYYVDKLNHDERFSLARWGDGELYCMWGMGRKNSNGCLYTAELKEGLYNAFKHRADPSFIYGLQRVLPGDEERVKKEFPDVAWHDSEIFGEAVAAGELYPFIEALREKRLMVVSNDSLRGATFGILMWEDYVTVPKSNAYEEKERVLRYVYAYEPEVVLFSCGMAANAFIGELHGKVASTLIDVGHIWDPFIGDMSRCDLQGKTEEDIKKNLHGS